MSGPVAWLAGAARWRDRLPGEIFQPDPGRAGGRPRPGLAESIYIQSGVAKYGVWPLDALRIAPGCPRTSENRSPSMGTADVGCKRATEAHSE